jgi:hypothetical protein
MKPQQKTDANVPPGTRPPAYVVELWVSEQLRDRTQRNGRSLAEALQLEEAQRQPDEPELEAEP